MGTDSVEDFMVIQATATALKPLDTQWSPVSSVFTQPLWSISVKQRLIELTKLPENWDSYGSPAVKSKSVEIALDILARLSQFNMTEPHVVPVPGGGIQFEWANQTSELEIEIRPSGDVEFLVVDKADEMLEGSIDQSFDSQQLFCVSNWFLSERKSVNELLRTDVPTY